MQYSVIHVYLDCVFAVDCKYVGYAIRSFGEFVRTHRGKGKHDTVGESKTHLVVDLRESRGRDTSYTDTYINTS